MATYLAIAPRHTAPYAGRFWILAASVLYGVALLVARRARIPRWLVFGIGAGAMIPLLFVRPQGSQDVFSYLFYGKMMTAGHNPLIAAPDVMGAHPWFAFVAWKHTPSVYGPAWLGAMRAVASVSRIEVGLFLAKTLSVAGVFVAAVLLARERARDGAWRALALLWNPLVIWSCALDGHVDGVLCALLVGAAIAKRAIVATACLVAAALIKPNFAIVLGLHLVILGVRRGVRHGLGAAAAAVVAYTPFWAGRATFGALGDIGSRFDSSFALVLKDLFGAQAARAIVFALLAVAVARLAVRHKGRDPIETWALAFAAMLFFSPWFLPWHIVPLIGLVLVAGAETRAKRALVAGTLAASAVVSFTALPIRWGATGTAALIAARRKEPTT